jgi:syntaxin 18
MDLSAEYWDAVARAAQAAGLGDVSQVIKKHVFALPARARALGSPRRRCVTPFGCVQEEVRRLKSAQLLRALGSRSDFTKAALEVARNVASLRAFLQESQQHYAQAGRLPERERDAVEEQVGAHVRACSANVAALQAALRTAPASSPAKQLPPSPQLLAHRQGMVLILSERLGAITAAFDRLRGLRYQQAQAAEANRRRRTPQAARPGLPRTTGALHAHLQRPGLDDAAGSSGWPGSPNLAAGGGGGGSDVHTPQHAQQAQVDAENVALQLELMSMGDSVQRAERSVREVAALNQMFSAAVAHQSAQIEKLYAEAVAATGHIGAANVQLGKAVRANRSSQKCMLVLLLLASAGLLFLDWWYS